MKEKIYEAEFGHESTSEREPAPKGTYTKPMIVDKLVSSFNNFRQGMDDLANVYTLLSAYDSELHRKVSRFGETMSKMLDGYAKLIKEQGGSVGDVTKPEGLQKYFGEKGISALGMNENKEEVFNARVDLSIDRIKSIMENSKR